MRKRFGNRKRRHGLIFGFHAIVFDVNVRKTQDFLNSTHRGTARFVRDYRTVLPLGGEEVRTDAPLLHLRRRESDHAPRQSLRTHRGRIVLSYGARVQLRGIRFRRRVRIPNRSRPRRTHDRRAHHEARERFPHASRGRSPYRRIRRVRSVRLPLRKPRTSGTYLEDSFGIEKTSRAGGFFRKS